MDRGPERRKYRWRKGRVALRIPSRKSRRNVVVGESLERWRRRREGRIESDRLHREERIESDRLRRKTS